MGEFELIRQFFSSQAIARDDVVLGIGDDCALLDLPAGESLAVTTDTLVSGIHFFPDVSPYALGYKSLAVNLSDLAAIGATPRWFSLAITLPQVETQWLSEFARGLSDLASQFGVALIGGDTTRGPLSITISAKGSVAAASAIRRSGAQVGDDIWVTGHLGAAALGVQQRLKGLSFAADAMAYFQQAMEYPIPRCQFGQHMRGIASAMLDLSDGFAGDLNHILKASQVSACVELSQIPVHPLVMKVVSHEQALQLALGGGDDYELCFTASEQHRTLIQQIAAKEQLTVTCVGQVIAGNAEIHWQHHQQPCEFIVRGWEHF